MKKAILNVTLKTGSGLFLEKGSIFEEPFSKELEIEIRKRPELFQIIEISEVKEENNTEKSKKLILKKK